MMNKKQVNLLVVIFFIAAMVAIGYQYRDQIMKLFHKEEPPKVEVKETQPFVPVENLKVPTELQKIFNETGLSYSARTTVEKSIERNKRAGFSGAVEFPFEGKTIEEIKVEIIKNILSDPVYGYMIAQAFTQDFPGSEDGSKLANEKQNKFVLEFIQDFDRDGVDFFIESPQAANGKIGVGVQYRKIAEKLSIILWNNMEIHKITRAQSKTVYYSNAGNLAVNKEIRLFRSSKKIHQNGLSKAIFYIAPTKGSDRPVLVYGFNIHDRRLEILEELPKTPVVKRQPPKKDPPKKQPPKPDPPKKEPPKPEPPKKNPPKPKGEEKKIKNPSGGSSGGGSSWDGSIPTPTPKPTPHPKDESKDPVNQGHAEVGGGKNQPSDSTGSFQKQEPKHDGEIINTPPVETIHKVDENKPDLTMVPPVVDSHDTGSQTAGGQNKEMAEPD